MNMFIDGTTPTLVDTSIPELWSKSVLRQMLRDGFWQRFIGGEGSGSAIIRKTDLLNNAGDTIHINVTDVLVGSGVSGDTAELIGNEEALATTEKKVIPTLYRHAVLINRRANKKSIIDLRGEAKLRLGEWGGQKMDNLRFAAFNSASALHTETYTPNVRVVGGGTGVNDIAAGDKLDVPTIQQCVLDLYTRNAKPLLIDGQEHFVLVAHPNALYDLKRSAEYTDWVQQAAIRGAENPFFKGSVAIIDNVVIFQHTNVATATNNVPTTVAKNIMFGAEAFIEGVDETVSWYEDEYDYGQKWGVAFSFAMEARRALEKNSIQVYSAGNAP